MKTYQLGGKNIASPLFIFSLLFVFTTMLVTGCKKENSFSPLEETKLQQPTASLVPDVNETEYSMADYQSALNDVTYDGDRLIFNNLSHFVTTAMALDSLGDSTAQAWFDGLGFTNSLYDEFENAVANMPEEIEPTDYFAGHPNSVKYDANNDVADVNAINGLFARLLNTQHKAVIGGNIYYSTYDADVTVSLADENFVEAYSTQGFEQDDENAIVIFNRAGLKTTGFDCLQTGWVYNMGEIVCGSPAQKKATIQMEAWKLKGSNNKWYSGAIIRVWHSKRGFLGFWYKDVRGSQVWGVFEGKFFTQAKIWGNSAYLHEYGVYITQAALSRICFYDVQVCVAPMCSGETICRSW